MPLDAKNLDAITYGPEYMLGKFANLPDAAGDTVPAEEFHERFGELFPGLGPQDYWIDVAGFRRAWHAKIPREIELVSGYLTAILNRSPRRTHVKQPTGFLGGMQAGLARDARYYPALKVDFSDGRIKQDVPPDTLLDWLAAALLHFRGSLGICERRGCTSPYFVKSRDRRRYCSEKCFRESRLTKQSDWQRQNRAVVKAASAAAKRQKSTKSKGGGR